MDIIWLPVSGYEGFYEVSNLGDVKSLDREIIIRGTLTIKKGRILKPIGVRYNCVVLCKKGVMKNYRVARLVAKEFIDNPHDKPEVNHKDGDRFNNNVNNLEWVTRTENARHAVITGLRPPPNGEKNGMAKLKDNDILEIRRLRSLGKSFKEIGRHFNVDPTNIFQIIKGKTWTHV